MPTHKWSSIESHPLVHERAWGEASALVGWAQWTVASLYYLDDLDRAVGTDLAGVGGHSWHILDLAHARWAATSAVTAIDLCAAALARRAGLGPHVTKAGDERELDLRQLSGKVAQAPPTLTSSARNWVAAVGEDPDFALLEAIRNPVTHSRLRRQFFRGGGGSDRTYLEVGVDAEASRDVEVGEVVRIARHLATHHVERFIELADKGVLEPSPED